MAMQYKRVIAAVDGSETGDRAAAFAGTLAQAMNLPLTLLHVFAVSPDELMNVSGMPGEMIDPARLPAKAIEEAAREAGQKAFKAARKTIGDIGVTVDEQVLNGRPAEQIMAHVDKTGPAIVVMGRHGHGRIGEFFLGSVSDRVVRQAQFPVTIVH